MNVLWQWPSDPVATFVLAHGAGAGMTHANLQAIADAMQRQSIATLRFNFPFMDEGRNRTDSQAVATSTVSEAFNEAKRRTSLPIWLGGHSFGGRMASHAVLDQSLDSAGLIFCSFPLHMPGKPSCRRAEHLPNIKQPMLFLSGTRDTMADRELLEQVVSTLPTAQLHWLQTADHGYHTLKRTRSGPETVFDEMARTARQFIDRFSR